MPGPEGAVRGFVSVFEDMTARIAAETALRESEDRFRTSFEGAGVGLVLGTVDGKIVRANRAYRDFLGYSDVELSGRNVRELLDPEHIAHTLQQLRDPQEVARRRGRTLEEIQG